MRGMSRSEGGAGAPELSADHDALAVFAVPDEHAARN